MSADQLKAYDRDDILPPIRSALSKDGQQYAIPFYGESSMLFYRKDLFAAAGIKMPEAPTWDQVYAMAKKLNKPSAGQYGIALRGLPGWGQNMAVFDTMINTFGARWFDMNWNPQFTSPEMKQAWQFYKKIHHRCRRARRHHGRLHRVPGPDVFGQGRECGNERHGLSRHPPGSRLQGQGQDRLRPRADGQERQCGRWRRPCLCIEALSEKG